MIATRILTYSRIGHCGRVLPLLSRKCSHIAAAFDKPNKSLITSDAVGLLGVGKLQRPSDFAKWQQQSLQESNRIVQNILSEPPSARTVDLLDNLSNEICLLADLANFIRLTHTQSAFVDAAEAACMAMLSLVSQLNTHVGMYKVLKEALHDKAIVKTMNEDTKIVGRLLLNDFERNGVHLDESNRKQKVNLDMEIVSLCDRFIQQSQASTLVSADQCPRHLVGSFRGISNYVEVGYTYHDSPQEDLREFAYRAYYSFSNRQEETLTALLAARQNMAQLSGFQSFAHQSLLDTMVATPENALHFLKKTAKAIKNRVEKELEEMLRLKQAENALATNIKPWDLNYFSSIPSKDKLHVDNTLVSEYFSVGTCIEGLSKLFEKIYNVCLVPMSCGRNELWADKIIKLGVMDGNGDIIGLLYCDLYARYKKLSTSDSHHTISGGKLLDDGTYQLPIVVLSCNFPPPMGSMPCLLNYGTVSNLFHEMGHAMHSMLGRTKYQHVTGTRCAIDIAEVPSILMERFANDHRVLKMIGCHYKTGLPLPDDIIEEYIAKHKTFAALDLQHHLNIALIDLTLHCQYSLDDKNTGEVVNKILEEYSAIPYLKEAALQLRIGHLGHYGAKYYSYIYSRAIASLIWTECFKQDPFSRINGENYYRKVLAHGGGKSPKLMIEDVLEREISTDTLVQALINGIES